jgi:uncharacterized protein YbjT (DUF2867 family)
MKVLLFGATGMVGSGVLLECLDAASVREVVVIGRSPTGRTHPKLREVLHTDFSTFDSLRAELAGVDACFFCLGVSSIGMDEAQYTRLTYDLTLAAARVLLAVSPQATFCYVSGVGTDETEHGRLMWARVKGRTENTLLGLGFRAAYMFRPGFIRPVKGARSKVGWIHRLYVILSPLTALVAALLPGKVVTTAIIGRAMLHVATAGYPRPRLEPPDIARAGRAEPDTQTAT